MRHGNKVKKLGRPKEHRVAMLNNLATSILTKGLAEEQAKRHVMTTTAKAKAVRGLVDRLITYAKQGDLSAKRQAARFVKSKEAFKGLFGILGERYSNRAGGYTRVLKVSERRHGDSAEMAIVSLVEDEIIKKPKKKKSPKKSAAKGATKPVDSETKKNPEPVETAVEEKAKPAGEKPKATEVEAIETVVEEKPSEDNEEKSEEKAAKATPKKKTVPKINPAKGGADEPSGTSEEK